LPAITAGAAKAINANKVGPSLAGIGVRQVLGCGFIHC
jgi:hypothetical protein